jgi:hypothetical protein
MVYIADATVAFKLGSFASYFSYDEPIRTLQPCVIDILRLNQVWLLSK